MTVVKEQISIQREYSDEHDDTSHIFRIFTYALHVMLLVQCERLCANCTGARHDRSFLARLLAYHTCASTLRRVANFLNFKIYVSEQ